MKCVTPKKSEEVLIERAVKSTFQIFHDKGLFNNYDNVAEILKYSSNIQVNERRRPDLEEIYDVIQLFYS